MKDILMPQGSDIFYIRDLAVDRHGYFSKPGYYAVYFVSDRGQQDEWINQDLMRPALGVTDDFGDLVRVR